MAKENDQSPWWARWGICLLGSGGAIPFVYGVVRMFDKTPPPWTLLACVAVSFVFAAAFIKPWRPNL